MRTWLVCAVILSTACSAPPPDCVVSSTQAQIYRVTRLTLPQSRGEFAYDLNGDGKPDDQLGNVIAALQGGLDAQAYVDAAFQASRQPTDIQLFLGGGGATAVMQEQLSGHDPGVFCARVIDGTLDSEPPSRQTQPTELSLTLAFADDVTVHVTAAQLFIVGVGRDQVRGELHGAIRIEELRSVVIPGVANLMNKKLVGDPNSATSATLAQLYDNAGMAEPGSKCVTTKACESGEPRVGSPACTNPNGSCANPCDGFVDICEVATNSIVKNVTAPDVDLFDDQGNFRPNPDNRNQDSLSVAVAFTAKAL